MSTTIKTVVLGIACSLVVSGANAALNISWNANAGFFPNGGDGSVGILGLGQSAIAQLIFSPDNINSSALAGGATSGGETILSQITVTNNGGAFEEYAFFAGPTVTGPFMPGFVYGRVFANNAPVPGTFYYDGPVVAAQDLSALGSPQVVGINRDPINGNMLNLQVIPEPTTLALLGVGVGTILYRRRRKA